MDVELVSGRQWPEDVERLLRGLPEWFGLEQALVKYVEDARTLPTTVACDCGEVVGACTLPDPRHAPRRSTARTERHAGRPSAQPP